jgi:hypothetical protein
MSGEGKHPGTNGPPWPTATGSLRTLESFGGKVRAKTSVSTQFSNCLMPTAKRTPCEDLHLSKSSGEPALCLVRD